MLNVFPIMSFERIPATRGVPATNVFTVSIETLALQLFLAKGSTLAAAKVSLTQKLEGLKASDFKPSLLREDEVALAGAIQPALAE